MRKSVFTWVRGVGPVFILLIMFGFVSQLYAEISKPLATRTIEVYHRDKKHHQHIKCKPRDFSAVPFDIIQVKAMSGVWCDGDDPTSGKIKIEVPDNACGFTPGVYYINEGEVQIITLPGTANNTVCEFEITITYEQDNDCTQATPTRYRCFSKVWCNQKVKKLPGLTQWGLIILVGLVVISGLWLWRKKRVRLAA